MIPYHGQPYRDLAEIDRSQAKDETSHFHAYATAYVIRKGQRYTAALTGVSKGEPLKDVVQRLQRQAPSVGIRPGPLLLDRGFYSVAVVRYFQAGRHPFLMPVVCHGRSPEQPGGPTGSYIFRTCIDTKLLKPAPILELLSLGGGRSPRALPGAGSLRDSLGGVTRERSGAMNADSHDLEFIYKEYQRLCDRCVEYENSSFNDFKLLGVIMGAILAAWKPVAESLSASSLTLLFGFIGILLAVVIIGLQDLMKQSIIMFYVNQIVLYEKELCTAFERCDSPVFHFGRNWMTWFDKRHRRVAFAFFSFFSAAVVFFPTAVLWLGGTIQYAMIYLSLCVLASIWTTIAMRSLPY